MHGQATQGKKRLNQHQTLAFNLSVERRAQPELHLLTSTRPSLLTTSACSALKDTLMHTTIQISQTHNYKQSPTSKQHQCPHILRSQMTCPPMLQLFQRRVQSRHQAWSTQTPCVPRLLSDRHRDHNVLSLNSGAATALNSTMPSTSAMF